MLARKVVTRSGRKVRGLFPSRKLKRMVQWESLLERDAILLFEFSAGVLNYQEQPCLIHYFDDESDSHRRYFPDFEIIKSSEEIVHLEVKPELVLVTPEISNKLSKVTAHYSKSSLEYRVLTEKQIRREPLHSNLKQLYRYLHTPFGTEIIRRVNEGTLFQSIIIAKSTRTFTVL